MAKPEHVTYTVKVKVSRPPIMLEFYQDKAGEHRWRMRGRNGRIVASSSEGYSTKWGCRRAARKFLGL